MKKRYRWNWKKCLGNLTTLALVGGVGMLLGYIFTMWMGGAA